MIGYKRKTKSVNKFEARLKLKLETTRGTKFIILHFFYEISLIEARVNYE